MLKITRLNVIDRITDRERTIMGNLGSDLVTSMPWLRLLMHHLPALGHGQSCLLKRLGMKRFAYCPASAFAPPATTWQRVRPTATTAGPGIRSTG